MNKRLDMSVLPDGFLIDLIHPNDEAIDIIKKFKYQAGDYLEGGWLMRPCMGSYHFNDSEMVIPDGLVVDIMDLTGYVYKSLTPCNFSYDMEDPLDSAVAVKILGVTKEYEEHGKELGMEVIET